MKIIYAPIIENTIPSFYATRLRVFFKMHPAVSQREVDGFSVQVTTLDNKKNITKTSTEISYESDGKSGYVDFILDNDITRNVVYKIQIAYVSSGEIGVYSSIAYGKCIFAPQLVYDETKEKTQRFSWNYSCQTVTEAVAKYRFIIRKYSNKEICEDSGWMIWDSSKDSVNSETRTCTISFSPSKFYAFSKEIELQIQTIGGYYTESHKTIAFSKEGYYTIGTNDDNNHWKNRYKLKIDNTIGGILLKLDFSNTHFLTNGATMLLYRAEERKGLSQSDDLSTTYLTWTPLTSFELSAVKGKVLNYIDTTVESGVIYRYAFVVGKMIELSNGQIYVEDQYLKKVNDSYYKFYITPQIKLYLEDAYISGGDGKILPIRFNPKVSSFKETVLETKVDTIGGKYPFFFRNGSVGYKEIPISGLISYLSDEAESFVNRIELGIDNDLRPQTNSLIDYNIAAEKNFKLMVLDWLNDGKPKLFRSPTEGNYLIRLMNISLSPNDTLGRMLHSFQATGYEIGDAKDYEVLRKYKIHEGAKILWSMTLTS